MVTVYYVLFGMSCHALAVSILLTFTNVKPSALQQFIAFMLYITLALVVYSVIKFTSLPKSVNL